MKISMEKLGALVRAQREKRGLTCEELAQKMGATPEYVRKAEAGRRVMTLQAVMSVCDALDIMPNQLLNHEIIEDETLKNDI